MFWFELLLKNVPELFCLYVSAMCLSRGAFWDALCSCIFFSTVAEFTHLTRFKRATLKPVNYTWKILQWAASPIHCIKFFPCFTFSRTITFKSYLNIFLRKAAATLMVLTKMVLHFSLLYYRYVFYIHSWTVNKG